MYMLPEKRYISTYICFTIKYIYIPVDGYIYIYMEIYINVLQSNTYTYVLPKSAIKLCISFEILKGRQN